MFTGLVQAQGRLEARETLPDGQRLTVAVPAGFLDGVAVGASIAVAGVCLTATTVDGARFTADASGATLAATTLGALATGAALNLERAATLETALGGHLVTGHVDGVGKLVSRAPAGGSAVLRFEVPDGLARYIARKGSVCVDGVSLTVNAVDGARFEVNVIPHTLAATTLGDLAPGDAVNVEVDLIARYVERLWTP